MIKPEKLSTGDVVALVNPAGMLPERFSRQLEFIKKYLVQEGLKVRDYIAYTDYFYPNVRADFLHAAFSDPDVKAIFPICGSNKIYEILPLLNYNLITHNPKIICGYSDLSALIFVINELAGIITFFGPHLNFINDKSSKRENLFTIKSFWNMLFWKKSGTNGLSKNEAFNFFRVLDENQLIIRNIYSSTERIKNINWRDNVFLNLNAKEKITGQICCLSLDALLKIIELQIHIDLSKKLVFLDTLNATFKEALEKIKKISSRTNIRDANAIIFSSMSERTDGEKLISVDLKKPINIKFFLQKVYDITGGNNILFGFPIGHCSYKLTIPIGIKAMLDVNLGEIIILEKPFK